MVTYLHLNLISDEVQFIKSGKGQPMLLDKRGYSYYKVKNCKKEPLKVYWRCSRKNYKCIARAVTYGSHINKYANEHIHPPLVDALEKE